MDVLVANFGVCRYGLFLIVEVFLGFNLEVAELDVSLLAPFVFESDDELLRFARRFIQLVKGFLRECRSRIIVSDGYLKSETCVVFGGCFGQEVVWEVYLEVSGLLQRLPWFGTLFKSREHRWKRSRVCNMYLGFEKMSEINLLV